MSHLGEEPIAAMSHLGEEPIAAMSHLGEEPIAAMSHLGEEPIAAMSHLGEEPIAAMSWWSRWMARPARGSPRCQGVWHVQLVRGIWTPERCIAW